MDYKGIVTLLKRKTKFDFLLFFSEWQYFLDNYYDAIINHYLIGSGIAKTNFNYLKYLENKTSIAKAKLEKFTQYNFDLYFDIFNTVDEIDSSIEYLNNAWKYFRVTPNLSSQSSFEMFQGDSLSIEEVLIRFNETDFDNKWADVAFINGLEEEDYTSSEIRSLKADSQMIKNKVNTFYDYHVGTNYYGKDILSNFELSENDGDLAVLENFDTLIQSANILTLANSRDFPDIRGFGIKDEHLAIGNNILKVAAISGSIKGNFSLDNLFKNVEVKKTTKSNDNLFIELEIEVEGGNIETLKIKMA